VNGPALTAKAGALLDLGRAEEARPLLTARLAEDPGDAAAWVHLARCHLSGTADLGEAEYALDQALAHDPEALGALILRQRLMCILGRRAEAQHAGRLAVHAHPEHWAAYVALSEALQHPQEAWQEAYDVALVAVRLEPEETEAHHALWTAAHLLGRQDVAQQALAAALAVDPQCRWAHTVRANTAAAAPGAKLPEVADAYADALAAAPTSEGLRKGLEGAVHRMLRGTRWLALLCVAIAGVTGRLFPGDGPSELPAHPGTRVYALGVMAAIWVFGAWRRYRGMRAGARLSVRALLATNFWARVAFGQALWCTLCAVVVVAVPWTERLVPQVLFWAALVPTLLTVWVERAALRAQQEQERRRWEQPLRQGAPRPPERSGR
jgi:tetratricopeptide (TPR) repeat protein